jgi:hypothetical protein
MFSSLFVRGGRDQTRRRPKMNMSNAMIARTMKIVYNMGRGYPTWRGAKPAPGPDAERTPMQRWP